MIQNLICTSSPYPDNILYEKLEAKIQNLYNNRQLINTPQNKNANTEITNNCNLRSCLIYLKTRVTFFRMNNIIIAPKAPN